MEAEKTTKPERLTEQDEIKVMTALVECRCKRPKQVLVNPVQQAQGARPQFDCGKCGGFIA